jgi:hypothetical protein
MGTPVLTAQRKSPALAGLRRGRYRRACRPAVASNPKGREPFLRTGVYLPVTPLASALSMTACIHSRAKFRSRLHTDLDASSWSGKIKASKRV